MMRRVILLLAVLCSSARAQVIPNADWQTIRTTHFRVHFTPELESQARRAAVNAERAWTRLKQDLVEPRGPVDLVIADNVDFTNGHASMYPTNRIVIYAHPPVHDGGLRFYDDWSELVITHELAHIFHLDRTRGWWRVAQRIFGRDPVWFPNVYLPAWIVEGLAVYEESRHTGAGRLAGTGHRMAARASAIGGHVPRLDELSAGTSRFPGGGGVYMYGSLLLEFLAQTRGAEGIGRFVEQTSKAPIPWFLNGRAEKAFGVTLEDAWRQWRDSLARDVTSNTASLDNWRELTPRGRYAFHPRWAGDSALIYVGSTGKDVASAYRVTLDGRNQRLGRRSAFDPNIPLADGSILYSQLEYTTPYEVRSDLWLQKGSHSRRITRDARLSYADARSDGRIVAVQAVPGSTRLVLLDANGSGIRPITEGSDDLQWAEPAWSPDGARIAALRLTRGAVSEIVIVDTTGAAQLVARDRSVITGLSWKSNNELVFSSDRTGVAQIYVATLPAGDSSTIIRRGTDVATGLFSPQFQGNGERLAAVHYRADGYHVGVGQLFRSIDFVSFDSVVRPTPLAAAASDSSRASRYSVWPSVLPRYWRLAGESSTEDEAVLGAFTSGEDIVGRHTYALQLQRSLDYPETGGFALYRFAGLGRPLLDFSFDVSFDPEGTITTIEGDTVGELRSRTRTGSVALSFLRPRMRTFAYASVGLATEVLNFSTKPSPLLPNLNPIFSKNSTLQSLRTAAGWTNARRPELSISREDGIAIDGIARVREHNGDAGRSHQLVGIGRGYRAFDLGAWAHYVLAVRAAGGVMDPQSTTSFAAGGTSGESIEVLPGFDFGTDNELFGVRGFPSSAITGLRAVGGTIELRGPLFAPSRGYRILPFFLDRTSFALFGEGASAWCPATADRYFCDSAPFDHRAIISVGAELGLLASVQYDATVHFRLGVATPVARRDLSPNSVTGYATIGAAF